MSIIDLVILEILEAVKDYIDDCDRSRRIDWIRVPFGGRWATCWKKEMMNPLYHYEYVFDGGI